MSTKMGLKDIVHKPQLKGLWTWTRGGGWWGPYIHGAENTPYCEPLPFLHSRRLIYQDRLGTTTGEAENKEANSTGNEQWVDLHARVLAKWWTSQQQARSALGDGSASASGGALTEAEAFAEVCPSLLPGVETRPLFGFTVVVPSLS